MWIFTTHGFLSVVQHNAMPDHFQIKSRVRDPLSELWPDHEIEVIDWADYRFRITIEKSDALSVLSRSWNPSTTLASRAPAATTADTT